MNSSNKIRSKLRNLLSDRGPKLLRDLGSLVSGQVLGMVLGFISFAYLARVLEPTSYGALEYAIAVSAFAATIIECGIGTIGTKEVAKNHKAAAALAAQVPAARLLLAFIVVPLVGLSSYLTGQGAEVIALVWVFALGLLFVPFRQDWLFQGLELMTQAAVAQVVRMSVFAVGIFTVIRHSDDLISVGFIELAAVTAMAAYFLIAQRVWAVPFKFTPSLAEPWRLIRQGATVGLSNMVWAFMLHMPMLLLTFLIGNEAPAWLGASQRLTVSLLTLSFVYHFNLYPVVARTLDRAPAIWQRLMRSSYRLVAWSTIGVALFITMLGGAIMTLVFGEQYVAAAPALSVLVWSFPMRVLSGHTRWALIASGNQHLLLFAEILGAATLVVSCFLLIPTYHAVGAAGAVIIGIGVSGMATQYFAETRLGRLSVGAGVGIPAALAAGSAIVSKTLLDGEITRAAVALAVYSVGLLALRPRLFEDLNRLAYAKADHPSESTHGSEV